MKTQQIIDGWVNALKDSINILDEEIQEKANKRSIICFDCESFISSFTFPILNTPVGYHCKECKCLYPALVLSNNKKCPLGKW